MRKTSICRPWILLITAFLVAMALVYGFYQRKLNHIEQEIKEIKKYQP